MVDFQINTGIRKIGFQDLIPRSVPAEEEWIAEDIEIVLSNSNTLATIVVDFGITTSVVVSFTTNGEDFVDFNNGDAVRGGQSRFIDVTNGALINFKAANLTNLNRLIVSSVP